MASSSEPRRFFRPLTYDSMRTTVARWSNGVRRVLARLPRHGENVWEGVQNDLFVAHLSIYEFAATR